MKATTKVLAVLWALVLAGLWMPQVALAGVCQISGDCCDLDADCGEGDTCLTTFGVCQESLELCEQNLDCGGHCSIKTAVPCSSTADCAPKACAVSRVVCLVDENCAEGKGPCVDQTCVAEDVCLKVPAVKGRCSSSGEPCTSDVDCGDEYCVLPGECTSDNSNCRDGLPTGTCSTGDFADQSCKTDAQCAYCSGDEDPSVWCADDGDCRHCTVDGKPCATSANCLARVCVGGGKAGLYCVNTADCPDGTCTEQTCSDEVCMKDPICVLPHGPEGTCAGTEDACQDSGDCGGGTCVFEGSCTVGTCSDIGGSCTSDSDCGKECTNDSEITCTSDLDCGKHCYASSEVSCSADADCGQLCSWSDIVCTSDADCKKTCHDDSGNLGYVCPDSTYCGSFCDPESTICECRLPDDEACETIDTCVMSGSCVNAHDCNYGACDTYVEQVCTNNRNKFCTSDDACAGCDKDGATCSTDSQCADYCSLDTDVTCTEAADCGKVCVNEGPSGWVVCTSNAQCPGDLGGECVDQTCVDNFCKGTCETLKVCQRTNGTCSTTKCTRDEHCNVGAGQTCTGNWECCTGTCGQLLPTDDPQCGTGDCESCIPLGPICTDADEDGYSVEGPGEGCGPADCDDSDPAVNPAGVEGPAGSASCSDTKDNDCDGAIDAADSGCAGGGTCAASASASTGPAGAEGNHSGWYLLLLAGVALIGVSAKRVFGHK